MSERPELTIKEASDSCGVSPKTIRRRLDGDKFPNAHRLNGPAGDGTGPWVIPVTDLIAAGLKPNAPTPPDAEPPAPVEDSTDTAESERITELENQLKDQTHRAELAEAQLTRADETIAAKAQALRMLEAGPQPNPPKVDATAPGENETEPLNGPESTEMDIEQGPNPTKRPGIWKRMVQEVRDGFDRSV